MLAARLNIELPITAQVEAVVNGHAAPADAAHALMLRALGQE
jgi:glycerol-3-phosphate dehydrogenase